MNYYYVHRKLAVSLVGASSAAFARLFVENPNYENPIWNSNKQVENESSFIGPLVAVSEVLSRNLSLKRTHLESNNAYPSSNEDCSRGNFPVNVQHDKEYDFVIVGGGNCGRSALKKLQSLCPDASIALIDPLRRLEDYSSEQQSSKTDYFQMHANGLDARDQLLRMVNDNGSITQIQYRHSLLIATGCHGAPIPHYIIDESARDQVLELRPTLVPFSQQRPILSPENVRQKVLTDTRSSQSIAILGSGWDAVDLSIQSIGKRKIRPLMIFGGIGPACHMLPPYLSVALSKRLRQHGIEVMNRTLIRYISSDNKSAKVQLYMAKSYDYLDTQLGTVDLVVAAPDVTGSRGNAVVPTTEMPSYLTESCKDRSWYQTWLGLSLPNVDFFRNGNSNVCSSPTVPCYKDDGRISVNAEYHVGSQIYAAGGAAKFPNHLTGHATVAGTGVHGAAQSGEAAATNMAQSYLISLRNAFSSSFRRNSSRLSRHTLVKVDPLPVWRSDQSSHVSDSSTALAKVGVHALCVGNCDSEQLATHAIWWTNQAALRRFLRLVDQEDTKERKRLIRELAKPVYGVGVIFYTDRRGRVQGIMTWGIPFADSSGAVKTRLVNRAKSTILSNGNFGSINTELDQIRRNQFLEKEARLIVAMSFGDDKPKRLEGQLSSFPRPLHRTTELRPPVIRAHGLLKRQQDGHGQGIMGEDLYAQYQLDVEDAPPPKPVAGVGFASTEGTSSRAMAAAESMYEWALWEQKERRWDENEEMARPTKEDALWIRKGDEQKNTPFRDTINAAYSRAIWQK